MYLTAANVTIETHTPAVTPIATSRAQPSLQAEADLSVLC